MCSEDFYREKAWARFFLYTKSNIPDSVVSDIRKLSFKYNLKNLPRIQQLTDVRKYTEELTFNELNKVFKGRTWTFNERNISDQK